MTKKNSDIYYTILQNSRYPEYLKLFYNAAIINRLPVVLWRLPNSHEQQAMVNFSGLRKNIILELDNIPPGFVLTPFSNQNTKTALFLQADLHLHNSSCSLLCDDEKISDTQLLNSKKEFEKTLLKVFKTNENIDNGKSAIIPNKWFTGNSETKVSFVTNEEYCLWVEKAVESINSSEIEKVVLSRNIEVALEPDFHPFALFQKLCSVYSNAFISLVALPGIGTWIGATPELLMSISDHELTTVALAGTRSVDANSHSHWGNKELVEQDIVSDYIKACFQQQNLSNFSEEGPTTVQIGNLLHLKTKFGFNLKTDGQTIDVNRFLNALHPTPAVCGVPKKLAYHFIQEIETHDRELYSGYLGPVNFNNQSQLFVNLRCLQLQKSSAILYAGSGITKDSIPEQEGIETELKLKALLNFLVSAPDKVQSKDSFSEKYSVTDRIFCDDRF